MCEEFAVYYINVVRDCIHTDNGNIIKLDHKPDPENSAIGTIRRDNFYHTFLES